MVDSNSGTFTLNARDLNAAFDEGFEIGFFAFDTFGVNGGLFFGAGDNLDFINHGIVNDPARWDSGVMIDFGAQNGVASAGGNTVHQWFRAQDRSTYSTGYFYTSHFLTKGSSSYKWGGQDTTGYMGIRFDDGTDKYYGWVEITNHLSGSSSFTIDSWAMETDANTGIVTGAPAAAVPEPTSLGLVALGLGAGGVRWQRRRRQQQAS